MKRIYLLLFAAIAMFNSCKVSLSGASTIGLKTVSVDFFENNAPLVVPYLSQQFTEALRTRIRNQSSLSMVQTNANSAFEGRITGYDIRPVTLTDNTNRNAQGTTRLTITVTVKYTNSINPKLSFEEPFSRYTNFPLTGTTLQALEPQLIRDITTQLTEDIFNRAFAQW
jgi:hypothetical protein